MTTCPSCSRAIPEGVQFCSACGTKLPTDSFVATRIIDDAPAGRAPKRGDGAARDTSRASSSPDSLDRGRFVAGTVLAERYRIITMLGRGGMGEVYKAEDLKLEQTVALKFLPEQLSADTAALARLYREVRVARQISHRNVCRVYDIGETGGLHFLSMEFVPGEELASLLRRIGRLPEDKAVEVARQLCAGLSAAHEQGVLHRDLKPANVMIDDAGNVRVLDFGLADLAHEFRGHDIRSGTPAYMAPEQLAGREVTTRSDLYALGLVIYELFTGKRAFEARSVEELLRLRESNSAPTSASSLVKDLDPLVAGALLAWRNLRLGRGDRRGAARLALFVLATRLVYWASITHHSPTIGEVTNLLVRGLQSALFWACFVGLMYLGLEPFLRRRWPGRVVSWARLLAGDLRDPLVGRDLLVGGAAGMAVCVLFQLKELAPVWLGALPNLPDGLSGFQHALVPSGFAPHLMNQIDASICFTFIVADALLLLSIVLRSNRAGMIAGWLLLSVLLILLSSTGSPVGWLFMAAAMGLYLFVITRYGLLALMSALLFQHFIVFFPATTDLSAWYATNFILEAVFLLAIAAYAFHTSRGGQPLFRRGLLEE